MYSEVCNSGRCLFKGSGKGERLRKLVVFELIVVGGRVSCVNLVTAPPQCFRDSLER
jgi:hypothetical protein